MGGTNKTPEDEAAFAGADNYPFWCSRFEQDLYNYYQPPNPPLELYVGADDDRHDSNCCHPNSHLQSLDHCAHYPDYHAHYLNYRHVVGQINARYHPKAIPFAPHWVDWITFDKEKDEADTKCGDKAQICKTGMFLAGKNVMVWQTTIDMDKVSSAKSEEQRHWASSKLFKAHP